MKKSISVFLIGIFCALTLSSCGNVSSVNNEEFSGLEFVDFGETNRLLFENLEYLEEYSEIIVVGTFIGDTEQEEIYQYDSHFGKDVLATVVSKNYIKVSKVIKGNVDIGDTVAITQRYGVVDDQFIAISRLTPMLKDDAWIFFLSENNEVGAGAYHCTGDNDGRYPLENFDYKKIALTDNENLGVFNKEDFREEIYKEILKKYDI